MANEQQRLSDNERGHVPRSNIPISSRILQKLFQNSDFMKLKVFKEKDQGYWTKAGIDLGLSLKCLQKIWKKVKGHHYMYEAVREIINEWINLKGSKALVSDLMKALDKNELGVFAGSLASLVDHQSNPTPSTPAAFGTASEEYISGSQQLTTAATPILTIPTSMLPYNADDSSNAKKMVGEEGKEAKIKIEIVDCASPVSNASSIPSIGHQSNEVSGLNRNLKDSSTSIIMNWLQNDANTAPVTNEGNIHDAVNRIAPPPPKISSFYSDDRGSESSTVGCSASRSRCHSRGDSCEYSPPPPYCLDSGSRSSSSKRDLDSYGRGRESDKKRAKYSPDRNVPHSYYQLGGRGSSSPLTWVKRNRRNERGDDSLTDDDDNPLQEAVKANDKNAVVEILKGTDKSSVINSRTNDYFQNTPLINASRYIRNKEESIDMIKILLENGADPGIRDCYRRTFIDVFINPPPKKKNFQRLSKISSQQFNRIVKILIKTGNIQYLMLPHWEGDGMYILQSVVYHIEVSRETIQLLHSNGIDFNKLNDKGNGVLYYALWGNQSIDMIKDLIEVGKADWKHVNENGWNLLHFAAKFNNIDAFELFVNLDPGKALELAHGLNINNNKPLDIFRSKGKLNYGRAKAKLNFVSGGRFYY